MQSAGPLRASLVPHMTLLTNACVDNMRHTTNNSCACTRHPCSSFLSFSVQTDVRIIIASAEVSWDDRRCFYVNCQGRIHDSHTQYHVCPSSRNEPPHLRSCFGPWSKKMPKYAAPYKIEKIRRQCRYLSRKQKDPYSCIFKSTTVNAASVLPREDVAQLLPGWWVQKFRIDMGTIPVIDDLHLEQWCMQGQDPRGAAIVQPATEQSKLYAHMFIAELRTVRWLLCQNTKGIAVPSHELWLFYAKHWPPLVHPGYHTKHVACWTRATYRPQWLASFRKRWNIGWRRMPPASPSTRDDMRRKVILSKPSWLRREPKTVQIFGHKKNPVFWNQ